MNDYLWDRSGEEADIEALEESLKQFRCGKLDDSRPPLPEASTRRPLTAIFRFAMIPASAVLAVASIWLFYAPQTDVTLKRETSRETVQRQPADVFKPVSTQKTADNPLAGTSRAERKIVRKRNPLKIFKRKRPVRRQVGTTTRAVREKGVPAITEEEEQAYNVLMKALLITSSKLKLVKEKVDGPDVETVGETKE